jgi:hypothetical protein
MAVVYMIPQVLLDLFLVSPLTKLSSYLLDRPCLGVIAVANAIKNMRALTKLDISRNNIPSDQEGRLQGTCAAGGTELAV